MHPLILLTFSRQLRKLGYLRVLDCADILALAGIAIPPTETAVALIDSDGSPRAIRGTVADVMITAEEHGVAVVAVH